MSHSPIMDSYTYWISFVVDNGTMPRQQFCAGEFTLYAPLASGEDVMLAVEMIEAERELPTGSVTVFTWKRIS